MTETQPTPNEDFILSMAIALLDGVDDPTDRDKAFQELAELISEVDSEIAREEYINRICKDYNFTKTTFKKIVAKRIEENIKEAEQQEIIDNLPKSLDDYCKLNTFDGVIWKADQLLQGITNPILRNQKFEEMAATIALINKPAARDDYAVKIGKKYDLSPMTFKAMIKTALEFRAKQAELRKTVRKNKVISLNGNAKVYPFFQEKLGKNGEVDININKVKFIELLQSFGFTRYAVSDESDKYTFVRINDNIIKTSPRQEIIDFIENFIRKEYDFDAAEIEKITAESLINKLYDGMKTYFSPDLFARMRTEDPIIVNTDTKDSTYLYYQNGFVEITKEGWKLRPYSEMSGSVWDHQILNRKFEFMEPEVELIELHDGKKTVSASVPDENGKAVDVMKAGYFADFCWHIAGGSFDRFQALCSIIGYLIHDFYQYKLKAILYTDSILSEHSDGRTGKTLLAKMIGRVRSYCEINAKEFDSSQITKYQTADLGTQVLHLNDLKHKGRFKFEFEDVFNDITEGYIVKKLYMPVFRQYSKIILSSNKTLNIQGASQRDRIVEFEVSPYFGEHRSPGAYYGVWFPDDPKSKRCDWDEKEFNRFDNFMCYCAQLFHTSGLIEPEAINLGERKLINYTHADFLEFMDEISANLALRGIPWDGYQDGSQTGFVSAVKMVDFPFDKRKLYERIRDQYPDLKKDWFTMNMMRKWMLQLSEVRYKVKKPKEWKSNGASWIQFIPEQ